MASMKPATTTRGISYISCGPEVNHFAVICVHGWACRATDFSYVFTELVKNDLNFRIIALDLPGHGDSSTNFYSDAGVHAFTTAIIDLINELSIPNVVLVGHSMGVRTVLATWKRAAVAGAPNVKGLCFLDGSTYKYRKPLFTFERGDARSAPLSTTQKHEAMGESFRRMFSPKTPSDFQDSAIAHVKTIDMQYNEAMRKSFIQYDYDLMDHDLEAAGEAGIPVLSFQATDVDDQNQRVMLKEGERSRWMEHVKERVPHLEEIVVRESGHFPHVDRPLEVARDLRRFVETLIETSPELH